jgi:CPA1 family monovalent cation:H+ antiporter
MLTRRLRLPYSVGLAAAGIILAVLPFAPLLRCSLRVTMKHQHVLLWGGLRGAVALALALGLPTELPRREEIVTITFAVVAFSVFAQSLTMASFLRAMGEIPPTSPLTG